MSKNLMWALILIVVVVILLLFNRDQVSVNLLFGDIKTMKSLVFLCFSGAGVAIGLLLK